MKPCASFSFLLLVWVCSVAQGAGDGVLTLHDCITRSLSVNPQLESEKYASAADKESIWKERASFLPDLTASAQARVLAGSPDGPFSILGLNNSNLNGLVLTTKSTSKNQKGPFRVDFAPVGSGEIRLTYPLYANGSIFGLNTPPAVAGAKALDNKQNWTIRLTQQEVIAKVAGIFFSSTVFEQKVGLDQEKVDLSKKRVDILQEELTQNLVLPQVLELAKTELTANQQMLVTSQQRAIDNERILAEFLKKPREKLRLDPSEPRLPPLPALNGFLDRLSTAHPAIEIQKANIEVAKQHYKLAQVALFPNVSLNTTYAAATAFGEKNSDLFEAGVNVDVPVFDFGGKLAAEHQALDELKSAQAALGEVVINVRESILTQLTQIHETEGSIAQLQANLMQADNAVNLLKSEQDQGIATQLALTDALMGLNQAKEQLLLARLVLRLQYAQLQRLSGGVWVWLK